MKVIIYCDTYPGIQKEHLYFTTSPSFKMPGVKRLSFEIHIPDEIINDSDISSIVPEVYGVEEDARR